MTKKQENTRRKRSRKIETGRKESGKEEEKRK